MTPAPHFLYSQAMPFGYDAGLASFARPTVNPPAAS